MPSLQNTFKFESFNDQISKVKVDIISQKENAKSILNEAESFLLDGLEKYRELNCTLDYASFYMDLKPYTGSYNHVVYYQKNIIDIFVQHLSVNNLATESILNVLIEFARDLQADFCKYFFDLLPILMCKIKCLLIMRKSRFSAKTPPHKNQQMKEYQTDEYILTLLKTLFITLAYFMKYLWRYILPDITLVFDNYKGILMDGMNVHVHRFSAESFGYLARKVKDYSSLITHIMDCAKHECFNPQFSALCDGIVALFVEMIVGVNSTFHNRGLQVLDAIFQYFMTEKYVVDDYYANINGISIEISSENYSEKISNAQNNNDDRINSHAIYNCSSTNIIISKLMSSLLTSITEPNTQPLWELFRIYMNQLNINNDIHKWIYLLDTVNYLLEYYTKPYITQFHYKISQNVLAEIIKLYELIHAQILSMDAKILIDQENLPTKECSQEFLNVSIHFQIIISDILYVTKTKNMETEMENNKDIVKNYEKMVNEILKHLSTLLYGDNNIENVSTYLPYYTYLRQSKQSIFFHQKHLPNYLNNVEQILLHDMEFERDCSQQIKISSVLKAFLYGTFGVVFQQGHMAKLETIYVKNDYRHILHQLLHLWQTNFEMLTEKNLLNSNSQDHKTISDAKNMGDSYLACMIENYIILKILTLLQINDELSNLITISKLSLIVKIGLKSLDIENQMFENEKSDIFYESLCTLIHSMVSQLTKMSPNQIENTDDCALKSVVWSDMLSLLYKHNHYFNNSTMYWESLHKVILLMSGLPIENFNVRNNNLEGNNLKFFTLHISNYFSTLNNNSIGNNDDVNSNFPKLLNSLTGMNLLHQNSQITQVSLQILTAILSYTNIPSEKGEIHTFFKVFAELINETLLPYMLLGNSTLENFRQKIVHLNRLVFESIITRFEITQFEVQKSEKNGLKQQSMDKCPENYNIIKYNIYKIIFRFLIGALSRENMTPVIKHLQSIIFTYLTTSTEILLLENTNNRNNTLNIEKTLQHHSNQTNCDSESLSKTFQQRKKRRRINNDNSDLNEQKGCEKNLFWTIILQSLSDSGQDQKIALTNEGKTNNSLTIAFNTPYYTLHFDVNPEQSQTSVTINFLRSNFQIPFRSSFMNLKHCLKSTQQNQSPSAITIKILELLTNPNKENSINNDTQNKKDKNNGSPVVKLKFNTALEKHHKDIVIAYLNFYEQEFGQKPFHDTKEEYMITQKLLKLYLRVLQQFRNPNMYQGARVKHTLFEFLTNTDSEVQTLALDALANIYKIPGLKDHSESLHRLCNVGTFRSELVMLSSENLTTTSQEVKSNNIALTENLMDIILRILYGKFHCKLTRNKANNILGRRRAILRFLTTSSNPLNDVITEFNTEVLEKKTNSSSQNQIMLLKFIQLAWSPLFNDANIGENYIQNISLNPAINEKMILGFFGFLSICLTQLGHQLSFMAGEMLDRMLAVLNKFQRPDLKNNLDENITNSNNKNELFCKKDDKSVKSLPENNVEKLIRKSFLSLLIKFFRVFGSTYHLTPQQRKLLFASGLSEQIHKLSQDAISGVSLTLKLLHLWSSIPNTQHLLFYSMENLRSSDVTLSLNYSQTPIHYIVLCLSHITNLNAKCEDIILAILNNIFCGQNNELLEQFYTHSLFDMEIYFTNRKIFSYDTINTTNDCIENDEKCAITPTKITSVTSKTLILTLVENLMRIAPQKDMRENSIFLERFSSFRQHMDFKTKLFNFLIGQCTKLRDKSNDVTYLVNPWDWCSYVNQNSQQELENENILQQSDNAIELKINAYKEISTGFLKHMSETLIVATQLLQSLAKNVKNIIKSTIIENINENDKNSNEEDFKRIFDLIVSPIFFGNLPSIIYNTREPQTAQIVDTFCLTHVKLLKNLMEFFMPYPNKDESFDKTLYYLSHFMTDYIIPLKTMIDNSMDTALYDDTLGISQPQNSFDNCNSNSIKNDSGSDNIIIPFAEIYEYFNKVLKIDYNENTVNIIAFQPILCQTLLTLSCKALITTTSNNSNLTQNKMGNLAFTRVKNYFANSHHQSQSNNNVWIDFIIGIYDKIYTTMSKHEKNKIEITPPLTTNPNRTQWILLEEEFSHRLTENLRMSDENVFGNYIHLLQALIHWNTNKNCLENSNVNLTLKNQIILKSTEKSPIVELCDMIPFIEKKCQLPTAGIDLRSHNFFSMLLDIQIHEKIKAIKLLNEFIKGNLVTSNDTSSPQIIQNINNFKLQPFTIKIIRVILMRNLAVAENLLQTGKRLGKDNMNIFIGLVIQTLAELCSRHLNVMHYLRILRSYITKLQTVTTKSQHFTAKPPQMSENKFKNKNKYEKTLQKASKTTLSIATYKLYIKIIKALLDCFPNTSELVRLSLLETTDGTENFNLEHFYSLLQTSIKDLFNIFDTQSLDLNSTHNAHPHAVTKEQIVKISLALPLTKFLTSLPAMNENRKNDNKTTKFKGQSFDAMSTQTIDTEYFINNLIYKLCGTLKSRAQSLREAGRDTLKQISIYLFTSFTTKQFPPSNLSFTESFMEIDYNHKNDNKIIKIENNFNFSQEDGINSGNLTKFAKYYVLIIEHLDGLLQKGYQRNVLLYTIHVLLEEWNKYDLTKYLGLALQDLPHKIFNNLGNNKDNNLMNDEEISTNTTDFRLSKNLATRVKCVTQKVMDIALSQIFAKQEDKISGDLITFLNDRENGGAINTELTPHLKCYENRSSVLDLKAYHTITLLVSALYSNQNFFLAAENYTNEIELLEKKDSISTLSLQLPLNILSIDQTKLLQVFAKLILAPILDFMLGKIAGKTTNSHNVSRQNLFSSPTGVKRLKRTLEHIRQGLLLQNNNNNFDSKTPKNKKLSSLESAKQQSTLNISHLILVHGLITGKLIQSLRDGDDTLKHKKSENKSLSNEQNVNAMLKNPSITPLYLQRSCYELDKPILIRHGQFKTEALLPEDDNIKTCMIDISGEDNDVLNSNKKLKRKLPVFFNTFCEFGLSYFLSILRNMDNNGHVPTSNEENGNCTVLAPFLPALCDIISSNTHSTLLKISALKCCSLLFVRFGTQLYTELTTDFEHVCKIQLVPALFTILDEYGSVNVARGPIYTLVVNALKTLATLIKKYKPATVLGLTHEHYKALLTSPYYTIDEDQLLFARFEGEAHEKRAACFVLLRALIARRIRVPELKSLMINVSRLMIYSDIEIMRESARQLYLKYIMVYSGYGVRVPNYVNTSCINEEYIPRIVSQRFNLRAQIQFICSNLSFGAVNGRLSLYIFLQALIHRLPITAFISQTWDNNENNVENINCNERNNSALNQSFATNNFTEEQRRAHHHQSRRKSGGKKRKKPDSNTVCIELLYLSLMARIPHETDTKCLDMLWNIVRTLFAKLAFAQESMHSTTTQLDNMSFGNSSMLTPSGKKSNKLSKYQAIVMELVKLALVWATFNKDTKKDNLQILGTDIISAYLQLFIEVSDTNANSTIDLSNDKHPYITNNQLLSLIIPKSMINDIINITSQNLTYALTQSYELKLRIEEELLNCPDFDHNDITNFQSGNNVGENDEVQSLLNDCKNNNNWTLVGSSQQPFPKHESLVKKESIIHELQSQQKLYDKFIFSTLTTINYLSQCSTAQIRDNIFESFISRKNKSSNTAHHLLQNLFSIQLEDKIEINSQIKLSTYLLQHTHHWIRKLVHCVWANVLNYSRIPHLVIRAMDYTNSEEFNQSIIQNNATPKGAKMKSISKNFVFAKNTDSFLLHFIRNHILNANVNQIQRLADSFFLHFRSPYIDLEFLKLLSPNLAFIGSCLFASEYGRLSAKEGHSTQNSNVTNFSYSEETNRYNAYLPPFFWFLRKMNREYVYEAKMGGHRQFEKRMILIQTMNSILSDLCHGIITNNSTPVKADSQLSEKISIPYLQERFRLEIENLSELLNFDINKNSDKNETKKINYSTFKELFTTINGSVIINTTSSFHYIPQYSFAFFIFSLLRWLSRSEKVIQIITSEKNSVDIGPPRTNGSEQPSSMMMISNVNIMALVSEFTSDIKHCRDLIKSLFNHFTNSDALYDKCTFCVEKLILEVRRKAKTEKVKQVLANPQNASLRKARKNIIKRESKKKKLLAIKMKPTLKKLNKKR